MNPESPERDPSTSEVETRDSINEEKAKALSDELTDFIVDNKSVLEAHISSAVPTLTESEKAQVEQALSTPKGKAGLSFLIKKKLLHRPDLETIKSSVEIMGEVGIKAVVRESMQMMSFASPILLAGSATVGAGLEIFHDYKHISTAYSVEDTINQLNVETDPLKRAAIFNKSRAAWEDAQEKGSPEQIEALAESCRITRTFLEGVSSKEELQDKPEVVKLRYFLEQDKHALKEYPKEVRKESKELLKSVELKIEKRHATKKEIGMAILKGAIVGAISGILGDGVFELVGGLVPSGVVENLIPRGITHEASERVVDSVFIKKAKELSSSIINHYRNSGLSANTTSIAT